MASYLGFGTLQFSGSLGVNDPFLGALCPSKSGLMNKHIVKHIVKLQTYRGWLVGWFVGKSFELRGQEQPTDSVKHTWVSRG